MRAVAEIVRTRVAVLPLAEDPDTLHGLLLLAEAGNGLRRLGLVADVSPVRLADLFEHARHGDIRPQPAYRGEPGMVPLDEAPGPWEHPERANKPKTLFPVEWQRQAIRMMLRSGGAPSRDLSAMLVRHGVVSDLGHVMRGLRKAMAKADLGFATYQHGHGSQTIYTITGVWAEGVRAVIANGWRAV